MIDDQAFSGGVDPGGLWTQNDIRILICFLLQHVNGSLSEEDILKIIQEDSLANYFETKEALSALLQLGHIHKDNENYLSLSNSGRQIVEQLNLTLPLSVRDRALKSALRLLSRTKNEKENRVDIEEISEGYQVHCHISGGSINLMTISLYVPDQRQALLVKEQFHKDPGTIYEMLLAALADAAV